MLNHNLPVLEHAPDKAFFLAAECLSGKRLQNEKTYRLGCRIARRQNASIRKTNRSNRGNLCFDWPGGADEPTTSIQTKCVPESVPTAVRASPVPTAGKILPTEGEVEGFDGGGQDVVEDHAAFLLGLAFSYGVERDAPDEEQDND